ncbi:MAG: hypothetical protein Q4D82_06370 [Neisseria sp.]|nr:hypothetical protein [Neisseria sp.]
MMHTFFKHSAAALLLAASAPLWADTADHSATQAAVAPTAAPADKAAQPARPPFKLNFPTTDDIKIVETPAAEPAGNTAAPAAKTQVKLRKQPSEPTAPVAVKTTVRNSKTAPARQAGSKAPVRTAAPAAAAMPKAPAKPQLSRAQILQREIQNERAALARAQAQLAQAQKKGGNTTALQQAVRDRQANIRALQAEAR